MKNMFKTQYFKKPPLSRLRHVVLSTASLYRLVVKT